MVLGLFKRRTDSANIRQDVSHLWSWTRHRESPIKRQDNAPIVLHQNPDTTSDICTFKRVPQTPYEIITPRHEKESHLEQRRSTNAEILKPDIRTREPLIHLIAPEEEGSYNLPNSTRQHCERVNDYIVNRETTSDRGRRRRSSQTQRNEEPELLTITPRISRDPSRSRSGTRLAFVKSRSSSNEQQIIKIRTGNSRNGSQTRSERSRSRRSSSSNQRHRGRSTSSTHARSPRLQRDARTPSPLPELDDRSIESPTTPLSYGLVTPLAGNENLPRSSGQPSPLSNLDTRASPNEYAHEHQFDSEPTVYDELEHSPEDYYNPQFSPNQYSMQRMYADKRQAKSKSVPQPVHTAQSTPNSLGLLPLSFIGRSSRSNKEYNYEKAQANDKPAPPRFDLSALRHSRNVQYPSTASSHGPTSRSPSSPSDCASYNHQDLETFVELPADTPQSAISREDDIVAMFPSSPAQTSRNHALSPPSNQITERSCRQTSTLHPISEQTTTSSLDPVIGARLSMIQPRASFERLRDASTHRRAQSETTLPSTPASDSKPNTPGSHTRSRSTYSLTPTRDIRADRRSFNTVRFLDSSGNSHEKLRRVLGI